MAEQEMDDDLFADLYVSSVPDYHEFRGPVSG